MTNRISHSKNLKENNKNSTTFSKSHKISCQKNLNNFQFTCDLRDVRCGEPGKFTQIFPHAHHHNQEFMEIESKNIPTTSSHPRTTSWKKGRRKTTSEWSKKGCISKFELKGLERILHSNTNYKLHTQKLLRLSQISANVGLSASKDPSMSNRLKTHITFSSYTTKHKYYELSRCKLQTFPSSSLSIFRLITRKV